MGYTFFNLACDVLEQSNKPLSIQEIWENAIKMGLVEKLSSSGKTLVNTYMKDSQAHIEKYKEE